MLSVWYRVAVVLYVPSGVAKLVLRVTVLMNVPWNVAKPVLSVSLAATGTVLLYVPSSVAKLALSVSLAATVTVLMYVLSSVAKLALSVSVFLLLLWRRPLSSPHWKVSAERRPLLRLAHQAVEQARSAQDITLGIRDMARLRQLSAARRTVLMYVPRDVAKPVLSVSLAATVTVLLSVPSGVAKLALSVSLAASVSVLL